MKLGLRLGRIYGLRLLLVPRVQLSAAIVVLAVVLPFRVMQFAAFSAEPQWGYDFSAYWQAGQNVLQGAPIYSAQQLAGAYPPQQQFLYLYPPVLAVLVAPIAALFDDYRAAAWLWSAVGAAIAAAAVVGVARAEGIGRRRVLLLLVAAMFLLPPVVGELVLGNVHLLLLGLLAASWIGVRHGGPLGESVAGVAVGIAALIKVFPVLAALWFVATGRWRAALVTATTVAVLVLATIPVVGIEAWLNYPVVLANLGPPPNKADALAPTVWLSEALSFDVARAVVTLAGLGIIWWSARRQTAALSFGVTVVVSLLVAPALYHTYLSLTALPFVLALANVGLVPLLGLSYLAMSGGDQPLLGDLSWIVSRALPTLGAVGLLAVLLSTRQGRAAGQGDQAAGRPAEEREATTSAPSS